MTERLTTLATWVALAFSLGVFVASAIWGDVQWLNWGDRDLMRAAAMGHQFPFSGAELSYGDGARIPGSALALILAVPLLFSSDPRDVQLFILACNALGAALLWWTMRRHYGPLAACMAVLVYSTSAALWSVQLKFWNPALMPLPVVVAYTSLESALREDRNVSFACAGVAIAVGAQIHLAVALWGACVMLPLALVRRDLAPKMLIVLGAGASTYLPYLLHEASTGWPNSTLFANQGAAGALRHGAPAPAGWQSATSAIEMLMPMQPQQAGVGSVLAAAVVGVGLLAAPGLALRHRDASGAMAASLLLSIVYYGLDGSLLITDRYVLPFVVSLSVILGVAAGRVTDWLRKRSVGRAELGTFAVILALAPAMQATVARSTSTGDLLHRQVLLPVLDATASELGVGRLELAGRLLVARPKQAGWTWRPFPTMNYPLWVAGRSHPGSQRPPCALLLDTPGLAAFGNASTNLIIEQILGQDTGGVHDVRHVPLGERDLLVYRPGNNRCVVSTIDAYVWTPTEERIATVTEELPCDGGKVDGTTMFISIRVPTRRTVECSRLGLALSLSPSSDGGFVATFNSRQLHGLSYNGGRYLAASLHNPTLVFRNEEQEISALLVQGMVGHRGLSTPLESALIEVPVGIWNVSLRADVQAANAEGPWPERSPNRRSVDIELGAIELTR